MAKFCSECGAPLKEGAAFCTKCGTPVANDEAPLTETPSPAAAPLPEPTPAPLPEPTSAPAAESAPAPAPPKEEAPKKEKKSKKAKKPKKEKASKAPENAAPAAEAPEAPADGKRPVASVGGVLVGACLAMECLPYLFKSLLMTATHRTFAPTLVTLLDVLGYVAAGVILLLGSRLVTGKARLSPAMLIPALWGGIRAFHVLLMRSVNITSTWQPFVMIALDVLVYVVFSILTVAPLCDLFSGKGKCRRRGVILAYLLVQLAAVLPIIMPLLMVLTPLNDVSSFLATMGFSMLGAFLEAGLMTLAANYQLRHLGEEKAPPSPKALGPSGVFGAVLAAAAVVVTFVGEAPRTIPDTVLNDAETFLLLGEAEAAKGDIVQFLYYYESAYEHCAAWRAVADGSGYTAPSKFNDDIILRYLDLADASTEGLRKYLINALPDDEVKLWAPLMLERYHAQAESGELSEEVKGHRDEMVAKCIAMDCFSAPYPLPEELQDNRDEINKVLNADETLMEKIEIAEVVAGAQRGEIDGVSAACQLLDLAEKYPQNRDLQLAAGYIGSQNTSESGGHYERSVKVLRHYIEMWEDAFGETATADERADLLFSIAGMCQDMRMYQDASGFYESVLEQRTDDLETMKALSFCYSQIGETKKGYELGKKLFAAAPDDPNVLWTYCLNALEEHAPLDAVEAAGKLADLVRTDLGDNADSRDELLYNLVLHLAYTNGTAGLTHEIYDGDFTEPEVLAALEKNAFLYDYVRAVYYEKQKNDQEQALPYVKSALAAQESSGRLWLLCGNIYFDDAQFEEAIEALKKADQLEPDDPTIQYQLANAYDGAEMYELALEYCDKALAHYPNGTDHTFDVFGVSAHAAMLRSGVLRKLEG